MFMNYLRHNAIVIAWGNDKCLILRMNVMISHAIWLLHVCRLFHFSPLVRLLKVRITMNECNMTQQRWPDNFTLSNVARAAKTHIHCG